MDSSDLALTELNQSEEHLLFLFDLLSQRKYGISHQALPSFEAHKRFVQNHPYRIWLLLQHKDAFVGSIYLHTDNSIGINILAKHYCLIEQAITMVQFRYKPLPAIKSVRNAAFHVHVPSADKQLEAALQEMNANKLQTTYLLKES